MIARLRGRLLEKEPHQVIVEAGGVGYRAFIPLSTFCVLPGAGAEASLHVHTHVREDALALYGFATPDELRIFERLIEISGIGPRLALAILSGLPAGELVEAISGGDAARLRAIPGVGPRTADRVLLELKDRIRSLRVAPPGAGIPGAPAAPLASLRRDVVSALVNLGYHERQAEEAVRRALQAGTASAPVVDGAAAGSADPATLGDVIRRSLKYLAS